MLVVKNETVDAIGKSKNIEIEHPIIEQKILYKSPFFKKEKKLFELFQANPNEDDATPIKTSAPVTLKVEIITKLQ